MATPIEYDYSIEDAKDDTGVDDNEIVGDEASQVGVRTVAIFSATLWVMLQRATYQPHPRHRLLTR